MKQRSVSDDILPIDEFKTRASEVIRRLKRTRRSVVVTQNGRASAVLISTELRPPDGARDAAPLARHRRR